METPRGIIQFRLPSYVLANLGNIGSISTAEKKILSVPFNIGSITSCNEQHQEAFSVTSDLASSFMVGSSGADPVRVIFTGVFINYDKDYDPQLVNLRSANDFLRFIALYSSILGKGRVPLFTTYRGVSFYYTISSFQWNHSGTMPSSINFTIQGIAKKYRCVEQVQEALNV